VSKKPAWLKEEGLQQLFAATKVAGGEARVVGGAVRDWLMGIEGGDVDVASTLAPERTIEIAAQQNWKAIPTGIEHGTVTLVLPERILEVTTLRRDVETNGRHAVVAFTDDWKEDAARRDFTMNALYMNADGELTDFFDGQKDLEAQRIRFIGDAATRITEDGLRILRYFRFLASHGKPPADEEALGAITELKGMVASLSGERIANEMRKLLSVENPAYSLRLMQQAHVAALVFGREITPQGIIRLHLLEAQADYQTSVWARALLLMQGANEADVKWLSTRWKLSRNETGQLQLLAGLPKFDAAAPRHVHTRLLRLYHAPAYLDWLLVQAALTPGIDVAAYVALALDFIAPVFPVTAKDLMAKGMSEGKPLGDKLSLLEMRWEESDYTLTKEELLS
jgi:tRNA nucleotidyltransferase/poly(A) polymerase